MLFCGLKRMNSGDWLYGRCVCVYGGVCVCVCVCVVLALFLS